MCTCYFFSLHKGDCLVVKPIIDNEHTDSGHSEMSAKAESHCTCSKIEELTKYNTMKLVSSGNSETCKNNGQYSETCHQRTAE